MDQQSKDYSHTDILLAIQSLRDALEHEKESTSLHRQWLKDELATFKTTHTSHDARITSVEKKQWTFAGMATVLAMFGGSIIDKVLK